MDQIRLGNQDIVIGVGVIIVLVALSVLAGLIVFDVLIN